MPDCCAFWRHAQSRGIAPGSPKKGGERVGSALLADETAKLRLLLVEPQARGMGRRLVEECIRFARQKRYRALSLWTNEGLNAARRIYRAFVKDEPNHSLGRDLIGQY